LAALDAVRALPADAAGAERLADPLLQEVLAAGADLERQRLLLEAEPLDHPLPFIEEIPVKRAGQVIWRSPIELEVLRRRPRAPERFRTLLQELADAVLAAPLDRRKSDREAIFVALERLRRDLERPKTYLPTPLLELIAKVEAWLLASRVAEATAKRRELENLLGELVELEAALARADGLAPLVARAHRLGDLYARAESLQVRVLTVRILHVLLAAEERLHPPDGKEAGPALLAAICRETASGFFDPTETAHRLRRLTELGLVVHSLCFALLRLLRRDSQEFES
jgi:hypothetical protein